MTTPEIDARGQACPRPVIMTKNALQEAGEAELRVLVDDQTAVENVTRFARNAGYTVDVHDLSAGAFALRISGAGSPASTPPVSDAASAQPEPPSRSGGTVVLITSDRIGRGADELGDILMKAFIFSLTESEDLPDTIVFMNSGVRLLVDGSQCVEHLRQLDDAGVQVVGCGTCLDYYGLKERVQVGIVSNMYEIASTLLAAGTTVSL